MQRIAPAKLKDTLSHQRVNLAAMWAIDLSVVVAWQKVFQCLPLSVNDLCSSFLGKHAVLRKDDAAACKRNSVARRVA